MVAAVFSGSVWISPVHAGTGLVCLADPSTASPSAPCPSSSPTFDGPVGSQIRIGVYISGSDALDALDLTLLTNHTILRPAGVDLTGTVLLGSPVILAECLSGVLVVGSSCASTDTADTLHLSAASQIGEPLTTAPTTGLLFTGIYNITGTSASGGIPIGYQTGCTGTSVSPNVCVTIANGTPTPNSETSQGGFFANSDSATMQDVAVSANQTSFGPEFPGAANHVMITATAENGFPGTNTGLVTFTSVSSSSLTVTISPTSCTPGTSPCSVVATLTPGASGNFSATIYGTYATNDPSSNPDTLVSPISFTVDVYDFGFTMFPTSVSFPSGEATTSIVTISSQNGFSGTVVLTATVVGTAGITASFTVNPISLNPGQTVNSTIVLRASPASPTTYHVRITATSGTRVKIYSPLITATVTARVTDFYVLPLSNSIGPVDAGFNGNATITIGYANGFAGTVNLSVSQPTGLTANLNMTSVSASHNVTLTASSLTAANYFPVVTAANSTATHTAPVQVIVVDFNLTAVPSSGVKIPQGAFGTDAIGVHPLNNFGRTVTLTPSAPAGLTPTFKINTATGLATRTLNITASTSIAPGNYTLTVTGTSGSLVHNRSFNVTVIPFNFTITASPTTPSGKPLANVTVTITLTSQAGAGTVNLSVASPSQVKASFNATSVNVPNGGKAISSLTLNATTTGSFLVNVTGTTSIHSYTVRLNFTSTLNDFSLTPTPSTVKVNAGVVGTSTITVKSEGTFSLAVALTVSSTPSGLSCSLNPTSVTPPAGGNANSTLSCNGPTGNYTATVTGTSGVLVHPVTVIYTLQNFTLTTSLSSLEVNNGASFTKLNVTVAPLDGFNGVVGLTVTVTPGSGSPPAGLTASLNPTSITGSGVSIVTLNGAFLGNYTVTVKGTSGTLTQTTAGVTVHVGEFGIEAVPGALTINEGSSARIQLAFLSENSFSGPITLGYTASSPGYTGTLPTVGFSPTSVTLGPGGIVYVTANVTVSDPVRNNNYDINITGTSGGTHVQFVSVTLSVPEPIFGIAFNPSPVVFGPSLSGTATVNVTSMGGIFGPVTLSLSAPSGLHCTLGQTTLGLKAGGSNTTSLTCNGSVGSYNVTITASGTTPYNSAIAPTSNGKFVVADFSITSTPSGITINTGQPGHGVISISWVDNYDGTVTLTLLPSTGLTASATRTTIQGGTGTANITVSSNTAATYTLTVNATSQGVTHSITLTVTVLGTSEGQNLFSNPLFLAALGVVAIAIVGTLVYLTRRGRIAKQPAASNKK